MSGRDLVKSVVLWVSRRGVLYRRIVATNVGVMDLLSLDRPRLQQVKQNGGDGGILFGNLAFGLKLAHAAP